MIADKYVYAVALIPFCVIWLILFIKRRDLRKEMIVMSLLLGPLSFATCYYWWTLDWWRPFTIAGGHSGIEDFVMGFTTGGIMAVLYEVVFKKQLYKRRNYSAERGLVVLLLLAQIASYLIYMIGFTTFWASTIAFLCVMTLMLFVRKDLVANAFISGILMALISFSFYYTIIFLSPTWIDRVYLPSLSGIRIIGVPIEELIFWFLSGSVFGPFYEYWQGEKLKKFI